MAEPVSLAEIKAHLDVARDDQDQMLSDMIVAAREWVENYTGLVLTPREVAVELCSLRGGSRLSAWPIDPDAAVTIAYTDSADEPQTISDARLSAASRPARLYPAAGTAWPFTGIEPIVVTVHAGYSTPADVPYSLKAAIKLFVGGLYAQRENFAVGVTVIDTGAVEALCHPYREQLV